MAPKGWPNGPKIPPKIHLKKRPGALGTLRMRRVPPIALKVPLKYLQIHSNILKVNECKLVVGVILREDAWKCAYEKSSMKT